MATPFPGDIELTVTSEACPGRTTQSEPITTGVPLPRGAVRSVDRLALTGADGQPIAIQAAATESWSDGSVRWALVDFQIAGAFQPRRVFRLRLDGAAAPPPQTRIEIADAPDGVIVDTGAARFEVRTGAAFPFAAISVGGASAIDASGCALTVTDGSGHAVAAAITSVHVEERGALRSSVRIEGRVGRAADAMLHLIARAHFFAGSAAIGVAVTLRNPRRAVHAGGFWELGDAGSIYLRDASVRIALPQPVRGVECAPEPGAAFRSFDAPFVLYQDSSGGDEWRHITHANRRREVPTAFRGYRLRSLAGEGDGLRATPAVRTSGGRHSAAIVVEHFWQNFPRAIEVDGQYLTFRMWPRQFADLHELQGGEQKTHRFTLAFGDDPMAHDALCWGRSPSAAGVPPEWYSTAAAVDYIAPASNDVDDRYRQLVAEAVEGPDSFAAKRERIDEYGWRSFGDLYADHENPFSGSAEPIVSHYNNQYDAIHGFACQYMRTGDERWRQQMRELATHVADIDVYHTDRDKTAFNGGLFWHTVHYVAAGISTHRAYPRDPRTHGGGPSNEHNYAAGLRLHWLLTGDRQSKETMIGLADWVIEMDDGRKNVLRWLSRSATGLASATRTPAFHGPGRGAGHSILALLDGHRLTGERRFLAKAEQLIRRCINPSDDIASLDLLNAEEKWSYTVFLQVLGKYLDHKAELGELDVPYAYALEALLRYARWMAEHEYPYLEKPEILEYPTETWAAQDMRKCEVFLFASQHAAGPERSRFLERATFFYDYSVSALRASPTRTLARPMVLLLSNGFMYAGGRAAVERGPGPPVPAAQFGDPIRFVPQKTIAKKRLLILAAAGVATTLLVAIIFFAFFLKST